MDPESLGEDGDVGVRSSSPRHHLDVPCSKGMSQEQGLSRGLQMLGEGGGGPSGAARRRWGGKMWGLVGTGTPPHTHRTNGVRVGEGLTQSCRSCCDRCHEAPGAADYPDLIGS